MKITLLNAARDYIIATQPFAGPMGHGFHPNLLRIGTRGVKSCLTQSLTVSWARLSEQIFRVDKWSLCRG